MMPQVHPMDANTMPGYEAVRVALPRAALLPRAHQKRSAP